MIILLAGSALMLLPFFWMVSTSFKDLSDVFVYPPKFLAHSKWFNYGCCSGLISCPCLVNTLLVTIGVLTELITSTMADMHLPAWSSGKNVLFYFVWFHDDSVHVMLVPTFELLKNMNLLNFLKLHAYLAGSYTSLWRIPDETVFGTFYWTGWIRQDWWCTPWGFSQRYIFPFQNHPLHYFLFLFYCYMEWFLKPLIYLSDSKKNTLTLGIYLMQGTYSTNWPVLMATFIEPASALIYFPVCMKILCLWSDRIKV